MTVPSPWAEHDEVLDRAAQIAERGSAAIIEASGDVRELKLPPFGEERDAMLRKQIGGDFVAMQPTHFGWNHRATRRMAVLRADPDGGSLNPFAVRCNIGAMGRVVLFDAES